MVLRVVTTRMGDSGRREGEPPLMGDEGSSPAAAFAVPVTCGTALDDAHTAATTT